MSSIIFKDKNMIPQALVSEKSAERKITLFAKTNIQFIDLDIIVDDELYNQTNPYLKSSYRIRDEEKYTCHLVKKISGSLYKDLVTGEEISNVLSKSYSNEDALALFENLWFPLPILKKCGVDNFIKQPIAWARGYLSDITEKEVEGTLKLSDGSRRYRLVIAFDTSVSDDSQDKIDDQLISREDLNNDELYGLCGSAGSYSSLEKFILDPRIRQWLFGIYVEKKKAEDPDKNLEKIQCEAENSAAFIALYVNLVSLIAEQNIVPDVSVKPVLSNDSAKKSCIPVQLVLDIGNSRTCGVLIEDNKLENKDFLGLRNLNNPIHIYKEPFPSCIEIAKTSMVDLPVNENIFDVHVFAWTSMVRTGFEAEALASGKIGNEGNTGLSSPKRYLWDNDSAATEWRRNCTMDRTKYMGPSSSNTATIAPISGLINDRFEAVFWKVLSNDPEHDTEIVFSPKGSRRSMMTMLIIEILSHAVSQINSCSSRKNNELADEYRYLESIILTIPPAMPKQEIKIYAECVHQAIGILWKAMKWDCTKSEHNMMNDETGRSNLWPPIPEVRVDWDEAMCGQICYLYNEIAYNYNGNVKNFFNATSNRHWSLKNDKAITLATIDIGGGTTDLVINRYEPEQVNGNTLIPIQMFKESFKIAGDDIVLQMIRQYVVPAIIDYVVNLGVERTEISRLLKEKLGGCSQDNVLERSLKRQFTHQILYPVALEYLSRYERYNPLSPSDNEAVSFKQIIEQQERRYGVSIAQDVFEYIEYDVNAKLDCERFHVKDVPIVFKLSELHNDFSLGQRLDICEKVFNYISEAINSYVCDIVIITGRPSRLPGVATCFKNFLNLPKDRIISFNQYHFDSWYPYINANGRVEDPKTSAVVGAVLCNLVYRGTLSNFYLKVGNLKIKSCIKYLGQLDTAGEHLTNDKLFFDEPLDFDDAKYKIPDTKEIDLPPGTMTVGYRQLKQERWPAYPLYKLTIDEKVCRWLNSHANYSLTAVLERTENENENSKNRYSDDGIRIKRIKPKSTGELGNSALADEMGISDLTEIAKLKLCTMPNSSLGENTYWLDTGSVMQNV